MYNFYMDCAIGIDPCMTFDEKINRMKEGQKQKINDIYEKQNRRATIILGSESEGIFHENLPMGEIPIPKPQSYHTYCQICNLQYDDFETHILTESHLKRAKNQPQIVSIDDMINEMNVQKKW